MPRPSLLGERQESQLPHQTVPAAAEALTRDLFCQLCYGDMISSREKIKDSWGLSHKNQFCSLWTFVLSTSSFIRRCFFILGVWNFFSNKKLFTFLSM